MSDFAILAQNANMSDPRASWAPVVLLMLMGIGFAVGNGLLSSIVGPSRAGKVKGETYESGMTPVGDAKRRFNVRFYLVAILFVAFDVEIVVMYPWAASFAKMLAIDPALGQRMFVAVGVFMTLVFVGYLYDIGKGVLKWD
jgi:NADH-quinone oxidoreductase subunit A